MYVHAGMQWSSVACQLPWQVYDSLPNCFQFEEKVGNKKQTHLRPRIGQGSRSLPSAAQGEDGQVWNWSQEVGGRQAEGSDSPEVGEDSLRLEDHDDWKEFSKIIQQ